MSSANSIKVVARFRPQNKIEINSGGQPVVRFDGADTCIIDVSLSRLRLPPLSLAMDANLPSHRLVGRPKGLLHL
jgi:hypothetical protein